MSKVWVDVAIPRPVNHLYTYELPQGWSVEQGRWVEVPFGKTTLHGCVVQRREELGAQTAIQSIKAIKELVCEDASITPEVFELCRWAHRYYHSPLGELLQCALPASVLKSMANGVQTKARMEPSPIAFKPIALSQEQSLAVQCIDEATQPVLLEGVTGSGKTEVYLEAARKVLDQGKSVLIMVPEIALTPQLHDRIEIGLGRSVALWHSALADGARSRLWQDIRRGDCRVVVGARSSIFVPLVDLGLIVVDEEHDTSYKQEERARYHARELAFFRAKQSKAKLVLGSATPALETLERAAVGRVTHVKLTQRFGPATMPAIEIVDLTEVDRRDDSQALLAPQTLEALAATIDRGEQAMVFLNRRGFAATLLCEDCGWVSECDQCSVSMTVYRRARHLRCHLCGATRRMPDQCPTCDGHSWRLLGAGTESLEDQLPELIPSKQKAKLLRLDRDKVTSQTRLESILDSFRAGQADILLGTQMLVKGHDFPNVTLVVVVLADGLFRFPDFRATERAYQTLVQMSGRAGRADREGKVMIQTFQPDHPVLQLLTGQSTLADWRQGEMDLRKEFRYPPFVRLARVRVEATQSDKAQEGAESITKALQAHQSQHQCEVLGPSEAPLGRVKSWHRWDLWIKGEKIEHLHAALRFAHHGSTRVHVDIDPYGM